MKNNKLIILLRQFSPKELKRFGDLVDSPFFNKSQPCRLLFQIIREDLKMGRPIADNKTLFFKVFPNKKTYNSSLSVVMSQLTRLAEEFLVQDQLREQVYYKKHLLLEALMEKEQWSSFEQEFSNTNSLHEKTLHRGPNFFYHKFLLTKVKWECYLENTKGKRQFDPRALTKTLDEFYLGYRLMLAYAANLRSEYDTAQLEQVMSLAETSDLLKNPIIRLFHTAVLILKEQENVGHFPIFMELLDQHHRVIPRKELCELFTVAANYCIKKMNNGNTEFNQISLDVYKKAIAFRALFSSKYISDQRIKNIVALAVQLGDFEWASDFLHQHIQSVSPNLRQGVYHFNQAVIHFYKEEYLLCMDYLAKMEKINLNYEINRKFLLIKIYYLLKEDQLLISNVRSFKEFLRTSKTIKKGETEKFNNFTKILLKMAKLRFNPKKAAIEKIKQEIADCQRIINKKWLMERGNLL